MMATVIKANKKSTTTITGEVLFDGNNKVTIAVTDKNGSRSIKSFSKTSCVVRFRP